MQIIPKFKALLVEEVRENTFIRSVQQLRLEMLKRNETLIRVHYSSLNYKDALSARGHKGITKDYPHIPGIDAAGIIEESSVPEYQPGDKVMVTGYDLGMNTSGGFSQFISVPASWIVKIPEYITLREAMIYGTAGFTAGISIYELMRHNVVPGNGSVLVTGATGGVGLLAVGMLNKIGYEVSASTGKPEKYSLLTRIGAKEIIDREEVNDHSGRPLLKARWSGAIDNVGGNTLSTVIRSTMQHGAVACVGNVSSDKLECSVYPFILRGVNLLGIDSAEKPRDYRLNIWDLIFNDWLLPETDFFVKEIYLEQLNDEIDSMLRGTHSGKVIINLNS